MAKSSSKTRTRRSVGLSGEKATERNGMSDVTRVKYSRNFAIFSLSSVLGFRKEFDLVLLLP